MFNIFYTWCFLEKYSESTCKISALTTNLQHKISVSSVGGWGASGASRPPKFSLTPHWFSQKKSKIHCWPAFGFTTNRLPSVSYNKHAWFIQNDDLEPIYGCQLFFLSEKDHEDHEDHKNTMSGWCYTQGWMHKHNQWPCSCSRPYSVFRNRSSRPGQTHDTNSHVTNSQEHEHEQDTRGKPFRTKKYPSADWNSD